MNAPSCTDLRELIRRAGFEKNKDFAEAAGLEDWELSKLLSDNGDRRPTAKQIRAIAHALDERVSTVVKLIVPDDGIEHDLLREFADDRACLERLTENLREATVTAGSLHDKNVLLEADVHSLRVELRATQQDRRALQGNVDQLGAAVRRLDALLHRAHLALENLRAEAAAKEQRFADNIDELQDEIAQVRKHEVIKTVITSVLSMAAGAVIRGAAGGRRAETDDVHGGDPDHDDDEEED